MGVRYPVVLIVCVALGADMFDSLYLAGTAISHCACSRRGVED